MYTDPDQCHRALVARDARFDGRFFVGVATTGIYCRPVCPARTPHRRNCAFFPCAAAAEARGFRPCLRCRPELAPGFARVDANGRLARAAARRIEDGALAEASLAALATELGVTDRHLRRVFRLELGVSPVAYAQTHRLLLAKRLLTDTDLSVLEVALASGFGSLRRLNALFSARYRMAPGALRRGSPGSSAPDRLELDLAYRPPYDWDAMRAFLAARAIPGVEASNAQCYRRTLRSGDIAGWIEVAPAPRQAALRIAIDPAFARAIPTVLARLRCLLDLACDPAEVALALGRLAAGQRGLRLPGSIDGFETGARAILGQQVSVKAATTLAGRFARAFGEAVATPHVGLDRLFPRAEAVARLAPRAIGELGVVRTRARALIALARATSSGTLDLSPTADPGLTVAALERIPGIGPWTAQYIAMRALAWPDAFPHPDAGVVRAMRPSTPREIAARAESWRPWRAYAVMHLWKSLEVST